MHGVALRKATSYYCQCERVRGHVLRRQSVVAVLVSFALALGMLFSATCLSSCSRAETWTLCLYLCGSDLESEKGLATKVLDELSAAAIPENVRVVIQTGGASTWQNDVVKPNEIGRYTIQNGSLVSVGSVASSSLGSASTLVDFLSMCAQNYQSDHTAVVLWDHGGGPLKGVCLDAQHDNDTLTLPEISEALAQGVRAQNGKAYDLVGIDACLMGSLETAAAIDDYASYYVASEGVEFGSGWDYAQILRAMRNSSDPKEIAAAACEGYLAHCKEYGTDLRATLSVLDLQKVQAIRDALVGALESLHKTQGHAVGALRCLAACSDEACEFGGSAKHEGKSNLVDLRGMAESLAMDPAHNGEGWNDVVQAVDNAVAYRIHGEASKDAFGVSIWYPRSFARADLEDYAKVTPLRAYASTLDELFRTSMGQVAYSDPGSIDANGDFHVEIAAEAADSFYTISARTSSAQGDYQTTSDDIKQDQGRMSFLFSLANAVQIRLAGMVLDAELVDTADGRTVYSCPVSINGERTNLRIARIRDAGTAVRFQLLGVWSGLDETTGLSSRLSERLNPGDKVDAISLSTGQARDSVTLGDDYSFDEHALEPGVYRCCFRAYDLHGNERLSNTITYKLDEEGHVHIVGPDSRS